MCTYLQLNILICIKLTHTDPLWQGCKEYFYCCRGSVDVSNSKTAAQYLCKNQSEISVGHMLFPLCLVLSLKCFSWISTKTLTFAYSHSVSFILPNHRLRSDLCFSSFQLREEKTWISPKYLRTYCYAGHYVLTLLADGYKFDKETWKNINFEEKVGWTKVFTKTLLAPTAPFCNWEYIHQTYCGSLMRVAEL